MSRRIALGMFVALMSASAAMAARPPTGEGVGVGNFDLAQSNSLKSAALPQRKLMGHSPAFRKSSIKLPAKSLPSMGGYRSQVDKHSGATSFLWANGAIKPALQAPLKANLIASSAGRDYMAQQSAQLHTSKHSVADARLIDLQDKGNGPVIARYQQVQSGIEVFGKRINVLMDRSMKLVASSGNFAKTEAPVSASKASRAFHLQPEQALSVAFSDLSGEPASAVAFSLQRSKGSYGVYKASPSFGEIRLSGEQRSKKVWYPAQGRLVPAYYTEINASSVDEADQYAMAYVVSADDGAVLFRKSLTEYDAFTYRTYADSAGIFQPDDSALGNTLDPFTGTPGDGSAPRVGTTPRLVTLQNGPISTSDPWLAPAATETTGNNVDAYLDLFGTALADGTVTSGQGFDPGTSDMRAATTGSKTFDYAYTADSDPTTPSQRSFAVVNLFYINNWLHDWWYDNGFNEAAGNAQTSNYGRGGVEGDVLLAEAQDFSGRNNANMSTPSDGGSPRMQQYLFDGRADGEVTITPSGAASYRLDFNTASFGPKNFDITNSVVSSAPLNGCAALTNAAAVAGNIAIIDRGSCTFATKVKNAQNAGATGVIIANNTTGAPALGGSDPTITIPTLSVSQTDGARIRSDLPATARLRRLTGADEDSSVDAQIVAHEWFHYVSNRLVGDATGLSGQQGRGMGEGWSDFSAMMLTVRADDAGSSGTFDGAFPQAYYSTNDSYFGIRRAPYSTSFATFPLTFKHIENGVALPTTAPIAFGGNGVNNAEVHNVGEIWCNTLWEIYAGLLNDPRYSFAMAQNRMKNYIIAGLKMTPNQPSLLDARDALLAAAYATDQTDFETMATAFAKRGMGVGAVAPDTADNTNSGVVESFTALQGSFVVEDASLDFGYFSGAEGFIDNDGVLDPGETALLTLKIRSNGTRSITSPVVAHLTSDGDVSYSNGGDIVFPASVSAPINYGDLVTGTIKVKLNSATSTAQLLTLTISFPDVGASSGEVLEAASQQLQLSVNYDIAPAQRASDDMEMSLAAAKDWGNDLFGSGTGWAITDGNDPAFGFATGLLWYTPDNNAAADIRLTTPALQVNSTPFSVAFQHYFQFEFDGTFGGTAFGFDGGVVEISSDNGVTWTDVLDAGGSFTSGAGYNGVIESLNPDGTFAPDDSGSHLGFVGDNFANNGGLLEPIVLSFGTAFTGQTVKLRFRQVSDTSAGDFGWAVDNVSFTGVTNKPFSSVVAEDGLADNHAPVANAGADRLVLKGATASLDGSASSDPDGDTLTYAWTQTSGATTTISNANSPMASVTPAAAGTYVFTLTVTDIRAVTSTDTMTVVVNTPPVANAGTDSTRAVSETVALDGSGSSDADGDGLSYSWTELSGPATTITGANSAQASFVAGSEGNYVFRLTVTDSKGASTSDTVTVNVTLFGTGTPGGGGGGGGALGVWLLLPGLAAAALRRRRRL